MNENDFLDNVFEICTDNNEAVMNGLSSKTHFISVFSISKEEWVITIYNKQTDSMYHHIIQDSAVQTKLAPFFE